MGRKLFLSSATSAEMLLSAFKAPYQRHNSVSKLALARAQVMDNAGHLADNSAVASLSPSEQPVTLGMENPLNQLFTAQATTPHSTSSPTTERSNSLRADRVAELRRPRNFTTVRLPCDAVRLRGFFLPCQHRFHEPAPQSLLPGEQSPQRPWPGYLLRALQPLPWAVRLLSTVNHRRQTEQNEPVAKAKPGSALNTTTKEMHIRVRIARHDLERKMRAVEGWLEEGYRAQLVVEYKSDDQAEAGAALVDSLVSKLAGKGTPVKPRLQHRGSWMVLLKPLVSAAKAARQREGQKEAAKEAEPSQAGKGGAGSGTASAAATAA